MSDSEPKSLLVNLLNANGDTIGYWHIEVEGGDDVYIDIPTEEELREAGKI